MTAGIVIALLASVPTASANFIGVSDGPSAPNQCVGFDTDTQCGGYTNYSENGGSYFDGVCVLSYGALVGYCRVYDDNDGEGTYGFCVGVSEDLCFGLWDLEAQDPTVCL